MYKVVDIGAFVPSTGEPRVTILDSHTLVKTASSEIQKFWDSMDHRQGFAYLWVIGVSAMEYYGCNNNGDAFTEDDLVAHHNDFVSNAHVFLHHVNKDPVKSVGRPVYSWYNYEMHRVELILEINKAAAGAQEILAKLNRGEQLFVSMGCSVAYDVCSICGNKSPTRAQYCDHLRFNMKKILPDGQQVYALNPNPKFFDISLVNKPADPTAFALDKVASLGGRSNAAVPEQKTSAALGEQAEDLSTKLAALRKISDIVKEVDGTVVDHENVSHEMDVVHELSERGFDDFEYPDFDHHYLWHKGISPAGLMLGLGMCGSYPTLGDALYMSGRHFLGRKFSPLHAQVLMDNLRGYIGMLQDEPSMIRKLVHHIMSDYNGEFDTPKRIRVHMAIIRPVAEARNDFINSLAAPFMHKFARDVYSNPVGNAFFTRLNNSGSNFAPVTLPDGRRTTNYHLAQASATHDAIPMLGLAGLGASAILATALTAAGVPSDQKMMATGLVALPSILALMSNDTKPQSKDTAVTLADGTQVNSYLFDNAWKERTVKTAAITDVFPKVRLGTALGMAVPGALAVDYAYNKWKNRNNPYAAEAEATKYSRVRNYLGSGVIANPAMVAVTGTAIGSQLPRAGKALWRSMLKK